MKALTIESISDIKKDRYTELITGTLSMTVIFTQMELDELGDIFQKEQDLKEVYRQDVVFVHQETINYLMGKLKEYFIKENNSDEK